MYIIPFYYYYFWRSLSFVTRRKVVDGGRVVEVRIFIGTIHLRDDEKYGKKTKVLECLEHRVVQHTQQERYASPSIVFSSPLLIPDL